MYVRTFFIKLYSVNLVTLSRRAIVCGAKRSAVGFVLTLVLGIVFTSLQAIEYLRLRLFCQIQFMDQIFSLQLGFMDYMF